MPGPHLQAGNVTPGSGAPGFVPGRMVFLIPGALALIVGLATGLARLGWQLPLEGAVQAAMPIHGPLMIGGFLGTLISLERAVALGRAAGYVAPASCGFGAVLLLAGLTQAGAALFTIGGFVFVAVSIRVVLRQPEPFSVIMLAGAILWAASNVFWLWGRPAGELVLLWMAFLLFTIAGERLELGRMLGHTGTRLRLFYATILVFGAATLTFTLAVDPLARDWSARLSGLAMLGLALWLLLFDMARRTVRQTGLVRFIAVCLLSGYAWLAVAGTLLACLALPPAGLLYDAILHCFFLGFVFAMIFGHAPIIFPSVLGLPVRFTRLLYIPLALLHLSLMTRICGDLFGFAGARSVGGAGNAAAIVLFLGLFAGNALRENAGKQLSYTIRRQT